MSRPDAPPVPPTPDDEQSVIDFLRRHPDFFTRHAEVLAELPVRHATGPAVSLMEKQVDVLRERNTRLQARLDLLLQTARDNESRVLSTNHLARNLIEADSLAAVVAGLQGSLRDDFSVEATCVALYDPPPALARQVLALKRAEPPAPLVDFFRQGITRCGGLDGALLELLFPDHPELRSAALVPLDRASPLGLLAIASTDAHRFEDGMGSMFLELTASLAAAALRHHWPADGPADDDAS